MSHVTFNLLNVEIHHVVALLKLDVTSSHHSV